MTDEMHILLVDDSDADNFLHKRNIELMGFTDRVSSALNGREAMDLLEALDAGSIEGAFPSIIFLDINMPVMDGWEFVDAFGERFGERKNALVVAMVSTSIDDRDVSRAQEHEVIDRHIEKPLTSDHVMVVLREHFPTIAERLDAS